MSNEQLYAIDAAVRSAAWDAIVHAFVKRCDELQARVEELERRSEAQEAKQPPLAWPGSEAAVEPDSDGWIPWEGGECPVDAGTLVDVRYRDGIEAHNVPALREILTNSAMRWNHARMPGDITHYRPAKQEPALLYQAEEENLCNCGAAGSGEGHLDWCEWIGSPWQEWVKGIEMDAKECTEPVDQSKWPQDGNTYWYIDAGGDVESTEWQSDGFDELYRDFLGLYTTREAAEEAAGKIKRVMEHWRNGCPVDLLPAKYTAMGYGIKLHD